MWVSTSMDSVEKVVMSTVMMHFVNQNSVKVTNICKETLYAPTNMADIQIALKFKLRAAIYVPCIAPTHRGLLSLAENYVS